MSTRMLTASHLRIGISAATGRVTARGVATHGWSAGQRSLAGTYWGRQRVSGHVFVDETKERGYFVAAAVLLPADVTDARRQIRGLILPRQRRIHFHKENDPRRNKILAVVAQLDVKVVIYDASAHPDVKCARDACLIQLVADATDLKAERLVLELDESNVKSDQKLLYEQVRATGAIDTLRYDHMRAHEECLLTIPDAVAWCWAKGGSWRGKIQPLVTDVQQV